MVGWVNFPLCPVFWGDECHRELVISTVQLFMSFWNFNKYMWVLLVKTFLLRKYLAYICCDFVHVVRGQFVCSISLVRAISMKIPAIHCKDWRERECFWISEKLQKLTKFIPGKILCGWKVENFITSNFKFFFFFFVINCIENFNVGGQCDSVFALIKSEMVFLWCVFWLENDNKEFLF